MKCFWKFSLLLVFGLTLSGCSKKETIDDGLTQDIHNIIPDDILAKIYDLGIEINGGNNPPNIEGIYLVSPNILVMSNFDDSFQPGYRFADYQYTFSDQNNSKQTVVCNYNGGNGSDLDVGSGLGAFITGEGNKFSVFIEVRGTLNGAPYKSVDIYSGEIETGGIRNWQKVLIMTQEAPNTIKTGQGRLTIDQDRFSGKITVQQRQHLQNILDLPCDVQLLPTAVQSVIN